MKRSKRKYSGKQIIKAGEKLIRENIQDDEKAFSAAMDILSYWRFNHEEPLDFAFKLLQELIPKKDNTAIFAKRLKRYPSIIAKLKRFDKMKLKNMQDIGGCRAIVSNKKKLQQVVRELRKRPEFKNTEGKIRAKNYVDKPKEDGYRGYHLVGQFSNKEGEKMDIEVQVRTVLQHDWATALEIVDLFTGQALKSNQGDKDWKVFFASVSEQFAIMEEIHMFNKLSDQDKFTEYLKELNKDDQHMSGCRKTQDYCQRLNVIKKLNAFAVSLKFVDTKLGENGGRGYVLIEINTEKNTGKATMFKEENSAEAEAMYTEVEKASAKDKHLVVALVSSTAVGGIKEAYPNYFADSTDFTKYLHLICDAQVKRKDGVFSNLFNWKK